MIKPPVLPPPRDDVVLEKSETLAESYGQMLRFTLRFRRFDGRWSEPARRDCFYSGPAVIVLPYDPQADEIVLIRQFRAGPWQAGAEPGSSNAWPAASTKTDKVRRRSPAPKRRKKRGSR